MTAQITQKIIFLIYKRYLQNHKAGAQFREEPCHWLNQCPAIVWCARLQVFPRERLPDALVIDLGGCMRGLRCLNAGIAIATPRSSAACRRGPSLFLYLHKCLPRLQTCFRARATRLRGTRTVMHRCGVCAPHHDSLGMGNKPLQQLLTG